MITFLLLTNQDDIVGELFYDDKEWLFTYSDVGTIIPLSDFPNINEIYQSKELWNFFTDMIPDLQELWRLEVIKREKIGTDIVSLLKRFVCSVSKPGNRYYIAVKKVDTSPILDALIHTSTIKSYECFNYKDTWKNYCSYVKLIFNDGRKLLLSSYIEIDVKTNWL